MYLNSYQYFDVGRDSIFNQTHNNVVTKNKKGGNMPRTKGSKNKATKATKTTTRTTNRVSTHYGNINEMARDAGSVLKSLVRRDGHYDTQTATAVSRLFGNQISLLKEKVNIAKINNQTTNTDVLSISE